MAEKFQRVASAASELNQLQDALERVLKELTDSPLYGARKLSAQSIGTSATTINHKLGRQPQGWIVTDSNAAATIYRTAWTSTTITLVASAAVTVDLVVF